MVMFLRRDAGSRTGRLWTASIANPSPLSLIHPTRNTRASLPCLSAWKGPWLMRAEKHGVRQQHLQKIPTRPPLQLKSNLMKGLCLGRSRLPTHQPVASNCLTRTDTTAERTPWRDVVPRSDQDYICTSYASHLPPIIAHYRRGTSKVCGVCVRGHYSKGAGDVYGGSCCCRPPVF